MVLPIREFVCREYWRLRGRSIRRLTAEPIKTPCSFVRRFRRTNAINRFPLIVIVDDSQFAAQSLGNFLWVTFTRSNPAADIDGIAEFFENKHWGCNGSLVIDARLKPHHAPPLEADAEVSRRVDPLFARGGPLAGAWLIHRAARC